MASHITKGQQGEEKAVKYLEEKGYSIVTRNFRAGKSEIDIIALHEEILVFVEVKWRSKSDFGDPEECIDEKKAGMVIAGAEEYIYQSDWHNDVRFDVVSIIGNEITHFQDAFY